MKKNLGRGLLLPLLMVASFAGCGSSTENVFTETDNGVSQSRPTAEIRLDPIAGDQEDAEISADSEGNFIVVWEQLSPLNLDSADIRAQRFAPSGSPLGVPFTVASSPLHEFRPSVAGGLNGSFVVTWSRAEADDDRTVVVARRFDGQDQPLGAEFPVSQGSVPHEDSGDIATDAQGNFVITWAGASLDEPDSVLARTFAASGAPTSEAFFVDSQAAPIGDPAIASDAVGNFSVVWSRLGEVPDVVLRRYNAAGAPSDDGLVLGPADNAGRFSAEIDMKGNGEAVVAYTYSEDGGVSLRIAALRLDSDGLAQTGEVFLSSASDQSFDPTVAWLLDGSFMAGWEEVLSGSHDILRIGRFAADGTPLSALSYLGTGSSDDEFDGYFDVNAEGVLGASWEELTSAGPNSLVSDAFVRFFPVGTP